MLYQAKSETIEYNELREIPTPESTPTWCPLPHHQVLNEVMGQLQWAGIDPDIPEIAISKDRARMFAIMDLRISDSPDFKLVAGIRNSHDKAFGAGFCLGSSVLVCDNLCFSSDVTISRKHTSGILREFSGLVSNAVDQIAGMRRKQENQIWNYKGQILSAAEFDHYAMGLLRNGIFSGTKIAKMLEEFESPQFTYDGGQDTLWAGFNAATHVLKGYSNPLTHTQKALALHDVTDRFVDAVTV